jgi:hypothetical protein
MSKKIKKQFYIRGTENTLQLHTMCDSSSFFIHLFTCAYIVWVTSPDSLSFKMRPQAGPEFLGSSDSPALVSWVSGTSDIHHYAWLSDCWLNLRSKTKQNAIKHIIGNMNIQQNVSLMINYVSVLAVWYRRRPLFFKRYVLNEVFRSVMIFVTNLQCMGVREMSEKEKTWEILECIHGCSLGKKNRTLFKIKKVK